MAIDSYSALKAAIAAWNTHTDIPGVADDLIDIAEARMSRDLRTREMQTSTSGTLTSGTGTLAVPSDFLEAIDLQVGSGVASISLERRPVRDFQARYLSVTVGQPEAFAIDGTNFLLGPTPDSGYAYTLRYYQRLPALTSSNTSNWLLSSHPDVYLWACLVESEKYLVNPEKAAYWESQYQAAATSLVGSDRRGKWKGGGSRVMSL